MHICNPKNSKLNADKLPELPKNQGGPGRHKCIFCAYMKGVQLALNNEKLTEEVISSVLIQLPNNQSGDGRHRCTKTALLAGYNAK